MDRRAQGRLAEARVSFDRDRLPSWEAYADLAGLTLIGRGRWRNVRCNFHDDGNPSMRVNVESGGWICMSCGAKGGDPLAHHMARSGLDFVQAARELGAWVDDARPAPERPRAFSARDALSVIGLELGVCVIVIGDAKRGVTPNDTDWQRFLAAVGRVEFIAAEAAR